MKRLYVIWDNKAEDTAGPFITLAGHDAVAVRDFSDVLNQEGSRLGMHAQDYDLVCLGELNQSNVTGHPEVTGEPRHVINGRVLMDAQKEAAANG